MTSQVCHDFSKIFALFLLNYYFYRIILCNVKSHEAKNKAYKKYQLTVYTQWYSEMVSYP